ncbi:MAG: response regulator [Syntrophobacteraceae bacterium]
MVNPHEVEILLVEDNPSDINLTLRALKKHNLANRVHVVKDGEAALEYFFGSVEAPMVEIFHPPKVILLDLKLPKVDGIEVLRNLKADERTRTIPVVVLTSSREDRDLEECYELGVNSYIVKPLEFESFMNAVCKLGLYWLLLNQAPR